MGYAIGQSSSIVIQVNLGRQVGAAGGDRLRLRGNIGSRAADLLFTIAIFLIAG